MGRGWIYDEGCILTKGFYALVADARKEDTDFYYWLDIVSLC
jgi:hypothetical protein